MSLPALLAPLLEPLASCDISTSRCTPASPLGGACSTNDNCDTGASCNGNPGVCQALSVVGEPCEVGTELACQGDSYCDRTTQRCTQPTPIGGACAMGLEAAAEQCRPGFCQQSACVSALASICNGPTE